ncbi:MAG TPA: serine/threonine-protein kinase [Fibrobacteraceae bacterium]|nr:serine/threonine-protein kinase [Fibrobacteraceae bacterium]
MNPYKILKPIGQGGFKSVYLIKNQGKQEALKVISLSDRRILDPVEQEQLANELRARSVREFQLLERFGGGCVVSLGSISGHEEDFEGHPSYVYSEELLPGNPLDVVIRNANSAQPNFAETKKLFLSGVDVIERLWKEKIVHRDIKPQNIMATDLPDRPFVFFDLGIAFDVEGSSLTHATFGPGTLRYRAPETLDRDYRATIDFRSDLFSLAATVFEFATGRHPIHHGSMSEGETVYRLLKKTADALAPLRPDFPPNFCDLVDRCLRKRPALRPTRLQELKQSLEA